MLVDIHSLLGELQMENSNFGQSIEEFEKAITVCKTLNVGNVRDLAYFHFMCAMAAEHGHLAEPYKQYLQATVDLLHDRLAELLRSVNKHPSQDRNLDETLKLASEVLNDKDIKETIAEATWKDIEELKSNLDELKEKDQELKEEKEDIGDENEENEMNGELENGEMVIGHEKQQESDTDSHCHSEKENEKKEENHDNSKTSKEIHDDGKDTTTVVESPKNTKTVNTNMGTSRKRSLNQAEIWDETNGEPKAKKIRTEGMRMRWGI